MTIVAVAMEVRLAWVSKNGIFLVYLADKCIMKTGKSIAEYFMGWEYHRERPNLLKGKLFLSLGILSYWDIVPQMFYDGIKVFAYCRIRRKSPNALSDAAVPTSEDEDASLRKKCVRNDASSCVEHIRFAEKDYVGTQDDVKLCGSWIRLSLWVIEIDEMRSFEF